LASSSSTRLTVAQSSLPGLVFLLDLVLLLLPLYLV
jgi:hypothetical protein